MFKQNLTLFLEQIYYVILEFFNSFPKEVVVERYSNSTDGKEKWQEFANDCERSFMKDANQTLSSPTDVQCQQFPELVQK